jgi:trk system potassium uptake protein TrkA
MRIEYTGAGPMTVITTGALTKKGHEVIIIEVDKDKIDRLSDELDCSFVNGDASKPAILSLVDPKGCDFLFCLTDSDQVNIITELLGRSMGFKQVVRSIEDVELQNLCSELELKDTIIPVRTMSQYLENMVRGLDNVELSTVLKHDARLFTFVAGKDETELQKGDEVIILSHSKNLPGLNDR